MPPIREVPEFHELLTLLAKKYRTRTAFAAALGMDPSRLSKALSGKGDVFDVVGCLRLARATGTNASVVLRAAGRDQTADLIEALYGSPRRMSVEDERFLTAAQRLAPEARRIFTALFERGAAPISDDASTSRRERKRRVS